MGTTPEKNNMSSTPVPTSFTATAPRRGRLRKPLNGDGIREAVRALYREIALAMKFNDVYHFEAHVRPIAEALHDVTGHFSGFAMAGGAYGEAERLKSSPIPLADRQRIVIATQQGRERLGVRQ